MKVEALGLPFLPSSFRLYLYVLIPRTYWPKRCRYSIEVMKALTISASM
jgi:glucose-6-phosphate-specific signal transduction histidine kinase